ncbi:unnamed protein product [Symbiodinium natans]|uniref:Fibronectin type-II domain-containing protein n=1 Tax=Symbiodinium natans TaxID=878477 RepID=A0A812IGB8_9DINO|nr:unnamed protein product [Symbiodinium natans]
MAEKEQVLGSKHRCPQASYTMRRAPLPILVLACAARAGTSSGACDSDNGGEDSTCALSVSMRKSAWDANESLASQVPLSEGVAECHHHGRHGHHHQHGHVCAFPFILDGVSYRTCTSYGHPGTQWCATKVDHAGVVTEGMRCAEGCPQDRRTALEVCKASSMRPGRCGAKDPSDVEACLVNACPARCEKESTFPYPGASPSYSALTGFPAMNDAILKKQLAAVKTLKDFAPGFSRTPEAADLLHSTLSYVCCKTEPEVEAYQKALSSFEFSWKEVGAIKWSEIGCSLDSITDPSVVYLEAFVPTKTNEKLMRFAHRLEDHMARLGFADSNPRAIPFHFVISMLPAQLASGPALNVADAMKALSKYDFGTTYLCEIYFLGLPCLGLPGCPDTKEHEPAFGLKTLFATDWDDCPYGKNAAGKTSYMTLGGLRIQFKVIEDR